ncbi:hypothetical protein P9G84_31605 [Brevibacillus centrosporus]|uniref:hypothetical protein n=1 Tax=Brevibacillus centrosporus TaxID=54910 RepID=UPI001144EAC2|nr:hypothetical protein [Brevibacillus centrosporus]MEC2133402.1 hypothetical protein [Brevibacillus centrosporus]GED34132.1 hypothetical protein BCE02nite_52730 [Brevibacillus centrosporus]
MTIAEMLEQVGVILLYRVIGRQSLIQAQHAWKLLRRNRHYAHNFIFEFTVFHPSDVEAVDLRSVQNWYNAMFESIVLERFPQFVPIINSNEKRAFLYGSVEHLYGEYGDSYPLYSDYRELQQRLLRLERLLRVTGS